VPIVVFTEAEAGEQGRLEPDLNGCDRKDAAGQPIHLGPGHGCPGRLKDAHAYMRNKPCLSPAGTFEITPLTKPLNFSYISILLIQ